MTTVVIGGPVDSRRQDSQDVEVEDVVGVAVLRYPPIQRREGSSSYKVEMPPLRLRALVSRTDDGFIAEVAELGVFGYGAHLSDALDDLRDAVRDYLTIVRDGGMQLAPSVAHHAEYVPLLDSPEESWLAAVDVAAPGNDAADLE